MNRRGYAAVVIAGVACILGTAGADRTMAGAQGNHDWKHPNGPAAEILFTRTAGPVLTRA